MTVDGVFFKLKQNVGNRHWVTIILMLVMLALAHNFGHNLITVSENLWMLSEELNLKFMKLIQVMVDGVWCVLQTKTQWENLLEGSVLCIKQGHWT